MGPRAGVDVDARIKVLCPWQELNPSHQVQHSPYYLSSTRGESVGLTPTSVVIFLFTTQPLNVCVNEALNEYNYNRNN